MVVLASASPRRSELLKKVGIEFKICVSQIEEKVTDKLTPAETVMWLARQKAADVAKKYPNDCVVGADTVVVLDGNILGKPADRGDAKRMLNLLSGREHSVFTGVCIIKNGIIKSFYESTEVQFYQLSQKEIDRYVDTGEPMDKAGAYGVQGSGCVLIKGIKGDYYNVVGLPIARVFREINS